ncbi:MAG: rhodanese-like domain-containing protein [Deltaproteobacteria bacterium]|nr:rhodanese-like domain-containing protein [Deltaproteobacteria bacterium]
MVATLNALEAAELIATSSVDVVDVRDFDEWQAGHLPAARVVPLDVLRADTDRELHGTKAAVLFVCARGVRSLNAAKMAERLGYETVYNLEGGTSGWAQAGLPLVAEQRVAA